MTKAREIISYGGAIADGWRQYAHRMLHYGKALRLAGRAKDDAERVRARKCYMMAVNIIWAEKLHIEAAGRLIRASRLSRKAVAA